MGQALNWDAQEVSKWISSLGFSQYSNLFNENNIAGDVLIYLQPDDLAEMGIKSVGHRLKILKSIYSLTVEKQLKPQGERYIPPTAAEKNATGFQAYGMNDSLIYTSFEIRDSRMESAEMEIKRLREDMMPLYRIAKEYKPLPTPEAPNQSSPTLLPTTTKAPGSGRSPTVDSGDLKSAPQSVSLASSAASTNNSSANASSAPLQSSLHSSVQSTTASSRKASGVSTPTDRGSEPFKSLRLNMEDSCSKVLPVALRKYKLSGDPSEYALLVCYDDQERLLGSNEKPLKIFTELQEAGRKPVFMLRLRASQQKAANREGVVVSGTPGGVL